MPQIRATVTAGHYTIHLQRPVLVSAKPPTRQEVEQTSGKTAIRRKKVSAPMQRFIERGILDSPHPLRMLDYGCGYGFCAKYLGMKAWDPVHKPNPSVLAPGYYDLVFMVYVLNTLPLHRQSETIDHAITLLAPGGTLLMVYRDDIPGACGQLTSKGTRQYGLRRAETHEGVIHIPELSKKGSWATYSYTRE